MKENENKKQFCVKEKSNKKAELELAIELVHNDAVGSLELFEILFFSLEGVGV